MRCKDVGTLERGLCLGYALRVENVRRGNELLFVNLDAGWKSDVRLTTYRALMQCMVFSTEHSNRICGFIWYLISTVLVISGFVFAIY
jgi:hypothetical protein